MSERIKELAFLADITTNPELSKALRLIIDELAEMRQANMRPGIEAVSKLMVGEPFNDARSNRAVTEGNNG